MDIHSSRKDRNHEIEFWRFFFAVVVFLCHMNVLPYGALGVDFFFLLTGILMMGSIQKAIKETKAPRSTFDFVLHKVKAFYPELLLATVFTISVALIVCFISNTIDTTFLIKAVKTFFNGVVPIKMSGIMGSPGDYNGATWYLSSMIIGISLLALILIFSRHGIDARLFHNKLCIFLGALSLPLYITHRITTTAAYDLLSTFYSPPCELQPAYVSRCHSAHPC